MNIQKKWVQSTTRLFVADTNGNTANFEAGETKELVGSLAMVAFQSGALAVQGPDGVVDTTIDTNAPDKAELREAVHAACDELRAIGEPDTFTKNGRPKVVEIEKICSNFDPEYITPKLVDAVWDDIIGK